MSAWTRLVRFEDDAGDVRLGQPADNDEDIGLAVASGKPVDVFLIQGDIYTGTVTNKKVRVKSLLAPISRQECSLIRCLGLNFREHAKEAGLQEPKEPVLFIKPRTSLAGPGDLPVSKWAQDDQLDYETELACVISQDAKDITEDKVPDYILGYTGANDVSARKLQFANSQWGYSKGLDNACPIGPVLVRASAINPDKLEHKGTLSGEVVQHSNTSDMIFTTKKAVSFLSQGTTLEKGTIILFGTAAGIGWTRSPRRIIKDGETMHIWFEGIGTLVNKFVYEK